MAPPHDAGGPQNTGRGNENSAALRQILDKVDWSHIKILPDDFPLRNLFKSQTPGQQPNLLPTEVHIHTEKGCSHSLAVLGACFESSSGLDGIYYFDERDADYLESSLYGTTEQTALGAAGQQCESVGILRRLFPVSKRITRKDESVVVERSVAALVHDYHMSPERINEVYDEVYHGANEFHQVMQLMINRGMNQMDVERPCLVAITRQGDLMVEQMSIAAVKDPARVKRTTFLALESCPALETEGALVFQVMCGRVSASVRWRPVFLELIGMIERVRKFKEVEVAEGGNKIKMKEIKVAVYTLRDRLFITYEQWKIRDRYKKGLAFNCQGNSGGFSRGSSWVPSRVRPS
ncbi:hypothetical protein GGR57DRAFT_384850 [Xylariaceae sp. FL1272]|nr:hypothetical protein GGR57DRAFT_384850 [Xylariaceae sp. FL1272]